MLKLGTGTLCGFLGRFLLVAFCQAVFWNAKVPEEQGSREANGTIDIQAAIDRCAVAGGGTVYVRAGDCRDGQLELHGNVTLRLESGATLWVSAREADDGQRDQFLVFKNTLQERSGAKGGSPVSPMASP